MSALTANEPFFELLGLQPEKVRPDFGSMRLPFKADLQQARGLVHGGAIASLIDSAGVLAIKATFPDAIGGATVSMTVNYLAPARQIDLTAEANEAPATEDRPAAFTIDGPNSLHVAYRGPGRHIFELRRWWL